MGRFVVFFVFWVFSAVSALATHVAVLETVADGAAIDKVSLQDRQYLTNVLREQAVRELPAAENYTIMTRENIQQMLPPGKAIEDCEGSCLVETGKNISADYVCQARVSTFGASLTLSAELYETAGNKLISSFNGRGSSVEELLEIIESKSADFFKVIKGTNQNIPQGVIAPAVEHVVVPEDSLESDVAEPESEPDTVANLVEEHVEAPVEDTTESAKDSIKDTVVAPSPNAYDELDGKSSWDSESVPANVPENPSTKSGARWVPLSLGAVALVAGTVLAVVGNNKAKNAAAKPYFANEDEFDKSKDDAKSGQTLRGVGIGLAIAGAVGIGLSIVF